MNIRLDELGVKITDMANEYVIDVNLALEERLDKTADDILDYIKKYCPKSESGSKHLSDSFVKTEVGSGHDKVIYISSQTKGRLVHLVELGFKHRSGKHVAARPFLRPAYDKFTPQMLEDMKSIINGGMSL